jgi:CheY-like chemotaxis protein
MTHEQTIVVVVEDDEDDFFFTQRVLRRHVRGPILHLPNGHTAIAYLAGQGVYSDRQKYPLPDILFVDLKMAHGTGHEVLAAVKQAPPPRLPRIFTLTGSNEPRDREQVLASGVAAGYIVKPLTNEHVLAILSQSGAPPTRDT